MCGEVYTRQTGCLIEARVQEHHQYIPLYQHKKSAIAKHSINLGQWIQLQITTILAKKRRQMDLILRKVTVTELHPNNMNKKTASP
jgi:hypothetical protein